MKEDKEKATPAKVDGIAQDENNQNTGESISAENEKLKSENADLKTKLENATIAKESLEKEIEKLKAKDNEDPSVSLRKEDKKGNVKIKFLLSPAGKFKLPYNVGQSVSLPANMADEIVDCRYAEYAG